MNSIFSFQYKIILAYEEGTLKKGGKVRLICDLPENTSDYQHVEFKLIDSETLKPL